MSFGLTNVGATFQRAMDYALKGLFGKIIEIYQDDLTVFSKDDISQIVISDEFFIDVDSLAYP